MQGSPSATITHSQARRRLTCLILLAITLPVGLAWRLAPLHLPQFAFKYGGSALWAVAVYWVVALLLPRASVRTLALTAAMVALGVELLKLLYWPPLDHFRETLAGKLLLGRYFTLGAIVAYWLAIAVSAAFDARFHPGRSTAPRAPQ
jgi:hypothetical protein